VYSLCRRGELEHHRISNAIRIPQRALAKYLASSATGQVEDARHLQR
jgi:hypothetical protein